MQPGAIYLASRTGLPIVPVGVGFQKAWRFSSWDRFALPVPGSAVYIVVHRPILVPAGLNREQLLPYCGQLQQALDAATHRAELWAATAHLPPWPTGPIQASFTKSENSDSAADRVELAAATLPGSNSSQLAA
ncbi:hypothetical protein HRbin36_01160 [bacterium HR36]|nr:hypothetical protein HRbin36_01160 [bacterium HR36]